MVDCQEKWHGEGGNGKIQKKQKKSHQVNDENDPSLGLYARRHFLLGEAIAVYLGIWSLEDYIDESHRLEVSHGKFIDVLPNK